MHCGGFKHLKVMVLLRQFFSHWSQCWTIGLIYNVMYGHKGKEFDYTLSRLWPSSSIKLMVLVKWPLMR